jgi:hypothetical protein
MFSFGYFPGVRLSFAEVSEPSVRSNYIPPLKMDLTEGSETSAKLNQTPGKYPKENIQIYDTLSGILFSSILCTHPNQRNLLNLTVSVIVGFFFLNGINFFIS